MVSQRDLNVFLTVIVLLGASRVLLSLVYLDEQMLTVVQEPYSDMPTKSHPVKRREAEKPVEVASDNSDSARNNDDHALNDLLQKFQENDKVARPRESDLKLEIDMQHSDEIRNDLAVKRVSDFKNRLSKLKSKWLHDKLDFWSSGSRACPDAGEGLYLLSVVNSEPLRETQRSAIRATWGGLQTANGEKVRTVFMVGHQTSKGTAESLMKKIQEEDKTYGDVIGTDVIEPKHLTTASTLRILAAFKWVLLNCPLVKYVFIGPDNLFVHQVNMVKHLNAMKNPKDLYLGRVRKDAVPQRDPSKKDFVDVDIYKPEKYPKYCVGGAGFVVSTNFMQNAYVKGIAMANQTQNFNLGDVYLGMLALNLKVWPKYKESFLRIGGDADYCDLRETISLGGFGSEHLMKSVWKNHSTVIPHCPNPIPNATEIEQWTSKTDNRQYFDTVLKLIHNPKKACWKIPKTSKSPYLLALVSSMPQHFELRTAIRQTWAAPDYVAKTNTRTLFILGKSRGMSDETQRALDEESLQFHDIIQADFLESFQNLTLKVVLGLRWVSHNCKQVSFVYKGDDDMLVNFERITGHLRSLPSNQSQRLFLGHMMGLSPVVREKSKYQVLRSQYPFRYFLPYFSGGGYIMSSPAVRDMYKMTFSTKLIPIDDAYAGILAFRSKNPITLSAASSKDFITTGSRKDACYLREAFNIHGFKRTLVMKETWEDFRNKSKHCEEPKRHVSNRKHL